MFSYQETLAAKAVEEQQLGSQDTDFADDATLLGRNAQQAISADSSNRYSFLMPLVLQQ